MEDAWRMWRTPIEPVTPRRAATIGALLVALGGLLWAPEVQAQCRFQSVDPMTFTGYAPWGPAVQATATLRYACPGAGRGRTVSLSISSPRTMAGPNPLDFELYLEGSTTPFPESPPLPVTWVGNAKVRLVGSLWAPQDAAPGVYLATLVATLYVDGVAVSTGNLAVSTTIAKQCAISPATLAFGIYDALGPNATAPRNGYAQLEIQCTRATSYWVSLDGGGNYGARRQMGNGSGAWLGYDLYADPALSVPWTPGATPAGMPVVAPSSAPSTVPVYGQIPPAQVVPSGAYQDVVLSTIHF